MNAQVGATKSSNVRQQSLRLYLGGPHAFLTKYGGGFGRFHTDGHVESDNNIVRMRVPSDAVLIAARQIMAGEAELMIAGGVKSMSRAPFVLPKAESRKRLSPRAPRRSSLSDPPAIAGRKR